MATLRREYSFLGMHVSFGKPLSQGESKRARQFANKIYNETKGPTPELQRLYAKLRENEQRSEG